MSESKELIKAPENDTEKLVRQAVAMRLSAKEGLMYLMNYGVKIETQTYYNLASKVKKEALQRLGETNIAVQHDQRIETLEQIHSEHWKNYWKSKSEGDVKTCTVILKEIKELQPYISSYHEATKYVLGDNVIKKA